MGKVENCCANIGFSKTTRIKYTWDVWWWACWISQDCSSGTDNCAPWWLPGSGQQHHEAGQPRQGRRQSLLETVSGKLSKLRSLRRGSVAGCTNEDDEDGPLPTSPGGLTIHKNLLNDQQMQRRSSGGADTDPDCDTPARRPLNLVRRASNLFGGGECHRRNTRPYY